VTIVRVRRAARGSSANGTTLPATSGVNTSNWNATAAHSHINFGTDYTGLGPSLSASPFKVAGFTTGFGQDDCDRDGDVQYIEGGGYYGNGCTRLIPADRHTADPARGEHDCGFNAPRSPEDVGDATKVWQGILMRIGSTWFSSAMEPGPGNMKLAIWPLVTGSNDRAIWITQQSGVTNAVGSGDGTAQNYTDDPDNPEANNDGHNTPDLNDVLMKWLWIELSCDATFDGPGAAYGMVRFRLWDEDGVYTGQGSRSYFLDNPQEEVADLGGPFVNGTLTLGANSWLEIEYVETVIGSTTSLGPPAGFPGSTR